MLNGPEARIYQPETLPRRVGQPETGENPMFTTFLAGGEGLLVDNRFVLAYKFMPHYNPSRGLARYEPKLIVLKDNEGIVLTGSNRKNLIPHFPPGVSDTQVHRIYFKPNIAHSIIIVGDCELNPEEVVTSAGYALKIASPAQVEFELLRSKLDIDQMEIKLQERLFASSPQITS